MKKKEYIYHTFFPITNILREKRFSMVEWKIEKNITDYLQAVAFMEDRVHKIYNDLTCEMVWLVEHPPLYTAGTSAQKHDLLETERFPIYQTGRGGKFTYHGPGQRVVYIMLDLKRRKQDIHAFVTALEEWGICTLAYFGIKGERRKGRVGVWISSSEIEEKIIAIGIRLRRWVSFHGIAFNVNPQLEHYRGIVPCGLKGYGVTSLADLGVSVSMQEVDTKLATTFYDIFGPFFVI